ncbi:MAG: glutathione S-transferase [Pseudomonadota bacterium]
MTAAPVLYSFRRCPYAIRARLAIAASGQEVELREVVLRDKPAEMLEASPKGTVPVLVLPQGQVLEESLDVIEWALAREDREGWREFPETVLSQMDALVRECDGPFKTALDCYKYPNHYENIDPIEQRATGAAFIRKLDLRLSASAFLFGERFSYADAAILPFVRQFAHVDKDWFWGEDWPNVTAWLDAFIAGDRFAGVMKKYKQWQSGEKGVAFYA